MKNFITSDVATKPKVSVENVEAGAIVKWVDYNGQPHLFVVSANKSGNVQAVSLEDGGFLSSGTRVDVLPTGEKITITVNPLVEVILSGGKN